MAPTECGYQWVGIRSQREIRLFGVRSSLIAASLLMQAASHEPAIVLQLLFNSIYGSHEYWDDAGKQIVELIRTNLNCEIGWKQMACHCPVLNATISILDYFGLFLDVAIPKEEPWHWNLEAGSLGSGPWQSKTDGSSPNSGLPTSTFGSGQFK